MCGEKMKPWLKNYGAIPHNLEYSNKTVYQLLEATAEKYPTNAAYEFMGRSVNYRDFLSEVKLTAKAFSAVGVKAGDRVAVALPNVPQALGSFYGLNMIGAVPVMLHPLSAPKRILDCLKENGSSFIVCLDLLCSGFVNVLKESEAEVTVLMASVEGGLPFFQKKLYRLKNRKKLSKLKNLDKLIHWESFLKNGMGQELLVHKGGKDDVAAIIYSGGTSGKSKGVLLSNGNFNALSAQTNAVSGYGSIAGMKLLALMPVSHGFGLGVGVHTPLTNGASCVLLSRFKPEIYAKLLLKSKPDFIFGVPTLFENMLKTEGLKKADFSFLKGVFCGGDSLSTELKKRTDEFLARHGATVQTREGYGASECLAVSCLTPPDGGREGSIGIPVPDTLIKIVKPETEEQLPFGEVGEIAVSGPTVMLGYMNEEKETADTLRKHQDGFTWLHTGDLGFMDADGFVYFKQRRKRVIISSGYNIYPSQLEAVIDAHPKVRKSCVIGVSDLFKIQRVKAFVVLEEGVNEPLDEIKKELYEYFALNIAKYAIPKEMEFRAELPCTSLGKLDYRALEAEEMQRMG